MKIKQVEELVGITSKNIRFYEEQGLLQPRRTENGYRDYRSEDVELLKQVKLFRKLGIPVEQIKKLFAGQLSMNECLENQETALRQEQDNIGKMRALTQEMLAKSFSINGLDTDYWLDEVEKMEKSISSINTSKTKSKKIATVKNEVNLNISKEKNQTQKQLEDDGREM